MFSLCDEPVSALDVSIQAQVLNLLTDMQARLGLSILFVSHDLAVVKYLCPTICVLQSGRIVEESGRDALFAAARQPYTRELIASVPDPDPTTARRARRTAQPPPPQAGPDSNPGPGQEGALDATGK